MLHQVGAGSLGPVFRAHDPAEGRLVAIKAFKLDITPEHAAELAAALEELAAAQPRHGAMAAAVAAGVTGSTAYLAQEYVAGEALDAVLRQLGPPRPEEALAILGRLAEALDRAAGEGLHHGAFHPRDVLIAPEETRLIDVGVAQALERCGLRATVRRPYAAPERVRQEPWGGAADIFALGAIAYELLTGRRITGPGLPAGRLEGLEGVDAAAVGDVLARALHEDPAERLLAASDLVDALHPALDGARRAAPSVPRPAPLPEPLSFEPGEDVAASPGDQDGGGMLDLFAPDEPVQARSEPPPEDPPAPAPPPAVAPVAERPPAVPEEPEWVEPQAEPVPVGGTERFTDVDTSDREQWPLGEPAPPQERAVEADPEPARAAVGAPEFSSVTGSWASRPPLASMTAPSEGRGRLLPLLVAVLVGVSAGFGWGYWTAWRTMERPSAEALSAGGIPESGGEQASEPQVIEEPEVLGEAGLPPPGRSKPAPAPPREPASREAARATRPAPRQPAPSAPAASPASTGRLLVRSSPAGARVLVEGRARGTTPVAVRELPLASLAVTIERPGYQSQTRTVALSADRPAATLDIDLSPAGSADPAGTGRATGAGVLVVESRPSGARVLVDGRVVGTTPLSLPQAGTGMRTVRLELQGFLPWSTAVRIAPGERTRVAASLEQGPTR